MPQINLLSPSFGKKTGKAKKDAVFELKARKSPSFIYQLIAGVFILMIIVWVILGLRTKNYIRELTDLEKKEASFSVDPQKLIKLNEYKGTLLNRLTFIEKLTEKRFLWSEKLERIASLLPEGVWLTEISSEKKISADLLTRKTKEEQFIVSIKGRAVAVKIQDAIELVGAFLDKLKNDNIFSKDFTEIKLNSVTKGIIANRDIMNFEFDCIVQ